MCLLLQVDSKLELTGMFDGERSYEIIVVLKSSFEFVRKARTDDATLVILNKCGYNHLIAALRWINSNLSLSLL